MTRLESMAVGGLIAALLLILYARSVTPTLANARPDVDGKRAIPFNQDRQYGRTGTGGVT